MKKRAGILLPLFSVPGNQGIGDLGQKTKMMIDEMAKAGFSVWSMLPLNPTLKENCPYLAADAFAGDPIYINIDRLAEMGLLTQSSIVNCNKFKEYVDYDAVRTFKEPYFQRAFRNFRKQYGKYREEFETFKKEAFWLNDWTVYELFRKHQGTNVFTEWEEDFNRFPLTGQINLRPYVDEIFYIQFLQFLFWKQFSEIAQYAKEKGISLMMDVPFFVEKDSAQVWAHRDEYLVDEEGNPQYLVGTQPDAFDEEGQIWNKPLWNFRRGKANGYREFRRRISWNARYFDILRILHFKAFDVCWGIPSDKPGSAGGWVKGPDQELLSLIKEDHPDLQLIAEDQGFVSAHLKELEIDNDILSMDILEWRLQPKTLKHYAPLHAVLYTSTNDTPTLEEEYNTYDNNRRIALRRFFKKHGYEHRPFHDMVIHYALDSQAPLVLVSLSDIAGLKENGRIGKPEPDPANWTWKFKDFKVFPLDMAKSTEWIKNAGRLPGEQQDVENTSAGA